jgi:hypothetical protein
MIEKSGITVQVREERERQARPPLVLRAIYGALRAGAHIDRPQNVADSYFKDTMSLALENPSFFLLSVALQSADLHNQRRGTTRLAREQKPPSESCKNSGTYFALHLINRSPG